MSIAATRFILLSIIWSWSFWSLAYSTSNELAKQGFLALGAFGPFVAAALLSRGKALQKLKLIGNPLGALTFFLLPTIIFTVLAGQGLIQPGTLSQSSILSSLPLLPLNFLVCGAFGEELGWRGFLAPELEKRSGFIIATVQVSAIWLLWHAPLFAYGFYENDPFQYASLLICFSFLFSISTKVFKSIWPSILMHASFNLSVLALEEWGLVEKTNYTTWWTIIAIIAVLTSALLLFNLKPIVKGTHSFKKPVQRSLFLLILLFAVSQNSLSCDQKEDSGIYISNIQVSYRGHEIFQGKVYRDNSGQQMLFEGEAQFEDTNKIFKLIIHMRPGHFQVVFQELNDQQSYKIFEYDRPLDFIRSVHFQLNTLLYEYYLLYQRKNKVLEALNVSGNGQTVYAFKGQFVHQDFKAKVQREGFEVTKLVTNGLSLSISNPSQLALELSFSFNLNDRSGYYQAKRLKTGKVIRLREFKLLPFSDYKIAHDKWTLIDFWGTWCRPCLEEVPQLNELSSLLTDSEVQFISVSCFEKLTQDKLKSKINQLAIRYPVFLNGDNLATEYNIQTFPQLILVNGKGEIKWIKSTGMTALEIYQKVSETVFANSK